MESEPERRLPLGGMDDGEGMTSRTRRMRNLLVEPRRLRPRQDTGCATGAAIGGFGRFASIAGDPSLHLDVFSKLEQKVNINRVGWFHETSGC